MTKSRKPWDWKVSMAGATIGIMIVIPLSMALGLSLLQALFCGAVGFTSAMVFSYILDRRIF